MPSSPTSPRSLGDGFESRRSVPTPAELLNGKNNLRPTDFGVVHPDLPGIRTRRGNGESAHQFTDLTTDARQSTHRLMGQPNGRQMLEELNGRTSAVNPGKIGTPGRPLTVADIYSGRDANMPMSHRPLNDGTDESIQKAYRYDGKPGAGQASHINYDETAPSANRFNSLGHESVHAWRASNGLQVSPLEVSPRRNDPVIRDNPKIVGDVIGHHSHMQEEFETVGLKPTPHTPHGWAPNENLIRNEHGLPRRNDYSRQTPAKTDELLNNIDSKTDDRSWFNKTFGNEPSPVGGIINHLEG
ncbi:type III secretion system effector protein [Archangium lipolyticum]|uniref:type III secretion system effector protein n=1 Tax=Archangium lipolyticum TaxID=2970465 RepID=UPI00214A2F5D|nr:type III secretion system effector protein [Archangium lipolyticum]